jgi:hypothetical protein
VDLAEIPCGDDCENFEIKSSSYFDGLRVELLPFDPMQSDLRPNCAVEQFATPPTLLRNALRTSG